MAGCSRRRRQLGHQRHCQSDAAGNAADAQWSANNADIAERQRQFDAIQKLLAPYVSAGRGPSAGSAT